MKKSYARDASEAWDEVQHLLDQEPVEGEEAMEELKRCIASAEAAIVELKKRIESGQAAHSEDRAARDYLARDRDAWKARAEDAEKKLETILLLPQISAAQAAGASVVVWSRDKDGNDLGLYSWEVCEHSTCGRAPGHEGPCDSFDYPASDRVPPHPLPKGWQ